MNNIKFALRKLVNTPFVTTVAVLSLALGIGANAAIYSLFEQMLLRPLPVSQPERLVNLAAPGPNPGSQSCNEAGDCSTVFSYAMFRDLQREQEVFTGVAGHRAFDANVAFNGQTLSGEGMMVSGSYFPVLGIQPALGRLIGRADDRTIGAHFVAVLSYGYWQTQLGGNPAVVDQTIIVNGHPMTVIGVAPRGFEGTTLGIQPDVFVPITMVAQMWRGFDDFENRRRYWIYLFARLGPGITMARAETAINTVFGPIINEVEAPLQEGMSDQTMARFRAKEIALTDGNRGQSFLHEEARTPLVLLFSITGIVLLIACANIANLLLARSANRSVEMAVRLSIGASRKHLIAQLMTESCLLAIIGGIVSLAFAQWTLSGIGALIPAEILPTVHLQLQPTMLVFTGVLAIGTGLVFGIFPALHSTRPDLITTIRADAGHPAGARAAARLRTSLVTSQIALSMALLISAGLFIRSLVNVSRVDLGMRAENVVTFGLSPVQNGYEPARSLALFENVIEELSAVPGVSNVTASRIRLLSHGNWNSSLTVQGFDAGPDTNTNSRVNLIGPDYFQTLGISLLAGREFTIADNRSTPRVAVINEAFARKFDLGRDVIGKYIGLGDELDTRIIGLVQDAKYSSVTNETPPQLFVPYRQREGIGELHFYARAAGSPDNVLRAVPRVISEVDPTLPVENLMTMPMQVRQNTFLDRMISILASAFAALATLLAAVGLYGVLAYTVARQTREIGVRMALGADRSRVRGMVLRRVGIMTVIGGGIGIAAALGLGRLAQSLLFEVEGHDPLAIAGAAVLLTLVALGAGYLPARQASRVEPMRALRYE